MSLGLTYPESQKFDVSLDFIKSAVREALNRTKKIDDNVQNIADIKFGDVVKQPDGNELVSIELVCYPEDKEVFKIKNG